MHGSSFFTPFVSIVGAKACVSRGLVFWRIRGVGADLVMVAVGFWDLTAGRGVENMLESSLAAGERRIRKPYIYQRGFKSSRISAAMPNFSGDAQFQRRRPISAAAPNFSGSVQFQRHGSQRDSFERRYPAARNFSGIHWPLILAGT